MHGGQARHAGVVGNRIHRPGAIDHPCVLPPDVEPLPERPGEALKRWLDTRHMATCERGAAFTGMRVGAALGELVLALARAGKLRSRRNETAVLAVSAGQHASFPRLRRSVFYRRARALQFKRNPAR